jgi:hypothetical protein
MREIPEELAAQPDRLRWNARYAIGLGAMLDPRPLALRTLSLRLPGGPVAGPACGPQGRALLA